MEQIIDARVIELAGNGWVNGNLVIAYRESDVVPLPLLADVSQRVFGASLFKFVQRDDIREVQHVDLLELAGRAILTGHYIDGQIHQIDDLGVALSDTCRLDDDQIESGASEAIDAVL